MSVPARLSGLAASATPTETTAPTPTEAPAAS